MKAKTRRTEIKIETHEITRIRLNGRSTGHESRGNRLDTLGIGCASDISATSTGACGNPPDEQDSTSETIKERSKLNEKQKETKQ